MRRGVLIGGGAAVVAGLAVTLGLRKRAERRAALAREAEIAARPDCPILDLRTGRRLRIVREPDTTTDNAATGT